LKTAKPRSKQEANAPQAWQVVTVCVFLVAIVWVVFGQTAHFEFVNYDDELNVYANPVVEKGLSLPAAGWAFTHAQAFNWVPLTTLSHELDCQIFGLRAGGHHLVNVLLHTANAALLFLVLRQMTGSLWRSAFVAAVFAVHPLRAESVAWVSERKDVLSAFFFILSIGAYVRNARKPSGAGGLGVVLLFALGLLAKSMVATLPFVLLLLDWWPLGRMGGMENLEFRMQNGAGGKQKWDRGEEGSEGVGFWGLVREKIPLFALSAGACVAAALVPGMVVADVHRQPVLERVGNALVSYGVYLRQMFVPAGLATPYPYAPNGRPLGEICLASVLLAVVSAAVIVCRKKRPCLLMGWLWYLGMLAPVIGIIQISPDAAHADRYTYLPGIGLAIAVTWAVADLTAGWKHQRVVLGGLMAGVIGALTLCGRIQTSYWKDDVILWTRALARTSDNYVAHYALGTALSKQGKLDEAIAQFQEALAIQPGRAEARYNLGNALGRNGRQDEAIAEYRQALEISPNYAPPHYNLGIALSAKGDTNGAIAEYRQALEADPYYVEAHNNLGNALADTGNLEEAIAQYRKALEMIPNNAELYYNLGLALSAKGDTDGAIVCYRQALKINPRSAEACGNLGVALLQKGEAKEAMDTWQKCLEIEPNQIQVPNNLAWLLATTPDDSLRNGAKAVALAAQANLSSGGGNPAILRTLAAAYAEAGNYGLAVVTARRALGLAQEQKNDKLAATLEKEIKLYEADTPIRDHTPAGSAPTARVAPPGADKLKTQTTNQP